MKNWYAITTRPRWEKKITQKLLSKGIVHFCPLQKRISQWSDRKKIIFEPVFKGFIFVEMETSNLWDIKNIDGVVNYVYWLGKPAVIREEEISTIKKFLNEFDQVEVETSNFNINEPVRITQGVLMNYQGIVLEISGNKALVRINSMGLFLTAHLNKKILESIKYQS